MTYNDVVMKRTVFRISLVVLLGVVTSVAVAWGCAITKPDTNDNPVACGGWMRSVPKHWPAPEFRSDHHALGVTVSVQWVNNPDTKRGASLRVSQFGLPIRCFEHQYHSSTGEQDVWSGAMNLTTSPPWSGDALLLPFFPIWPGLLANTAIYGGVWWAILFGPGMLIRWRRRRAGRCAKCGYDLRGSVSGECPECGVGNDKV